jgi:hypothetical protein
VLLASALKLLNVPTGLLAVILGAVILIGSALWGALDAAGHPAEIWAAADLSRSRWIRWLVRGAPFGVGTAAAVAYAARIRPRLTAAGADRASAGREPSSEVG